MAQSYKTLKENFVSNLSGGSVSEINYVTAVAPVSGLYGVERLDRLILMIGSIPTMVCSPVASTVLH